MHGILKKIPTNNKFCRKETHTMVPAVNYKDVREYLTESHYGDYGDGPNARRSGKVLLCGLLFTSPGLPLAKKEIIPRMDYFHNRSGDNCHFFCAGFAAYGGPIDDYTESGVDGWIYSDSKFNRFRAEIEGCTSWRYSGESDLLLTNAQYVNTRKSATLQMNSAVVCHLEGMKSDGAITSVSSFFESIFQYAESANGKDPRWGFSDSRATGAVPKSITRLVLSAMPKTVGEAKDRRRRRQSIIPFCYQGYSE